MTDGTRHVCPACTSERVHPFFEMLDVPVHCNLLWTSAEAARRCPRGDIRLALCTNCGFIFNQSFDESLMHYTGAYENSLCFSRKFQEYAHDLAQHLVEKYDLHDKAVIEIGSGKGDFLLLLCQLGNNRGWGFDPSYVPTPHRDDERDRVTFIRDFYSPRYANYAADLICCRQTLEHIRFPGQLVATVRQGIGERSDTGVFFEVPNALHIFENLGIWDIIYEHCGYFTPTALAHVFCMSGFHVQEIAVEFGGQYLGIHAFPQNGGSKPGTSLTSDQRAEIENGLADFALKFERKLQRWQIILSKIKNEGQRAVIWGAGSKGVTFLNLLSAQNNIRYVVDINPRKQGKYVAGTGQEIVPPEFLRDYRPDVVILMNAIYQNEIEILSSKLGVTPQLRCVSDENHDC